MAKWVFKFYMRATFKLTAPPEMPWEVGHIESIGHINTGYQIISYYYYLVAIFTYKSSCGVFIPIDSRPPVLLVYSSAHCNAAA